MRAIVLISVFIFTLLQGTFFRLNLVLLTVLCLSALAAVQQGNQEQATVNSLILAFVSGFILDLFSGMKIGFSSFWLLIFVFLELLYSRRFNPLHPAFLPLFIFGSSMVWGRIAYHVWLWSPSIILAVLGFLVRNLFVWMFDLSSKQKIRQW